MPRGSYGAVLVAAALVLGGLAWSAPAGSQTDCTLTESYVNPTGGTSPVITDSTPYISFTTPNPTLVNFTVDTNNAAFCDASGRDSNGQSWQIVAGTPAPALSHQAPPGAYVQAVVVRARPLAASTTSTSGPSTTSSTSTSSTSTSSTSSTTSTSTSSTSTTTTTFPPPGYGIGPVGTSSQTLARTSPDAASVRGGTRMDVVVGGENGHVFWQWQDRSPWSNWFDLGAPPNGIRNAPSITSWGPGRLDVFARGADDKLWQTYTQNGGQQWSGWLRVFEDGVLASGPGVSSRGPNRLNVFVVGTDGNIWERHYDGPQFGWNSLWLPHGAPGIGISGDTNGRDPAPVSWQGSDTERVDVFVRGADNKLWQAFYDGSGWSPWAKPVGDDGVLASEPEAISWAEGNILIFVRGTDDRAYVLPYGGVWGTWNRMLKWTDSWRSGPGATSRGSGSFDLFLRGVDDIVYYVWQ